MPILLQIKLLKKSYQLDKQKILLKFLRKKTKVLLIIKILILKHLNNQYQRKSDLM